VRGEGRIAGRYCLRPLLPRAAPRVNVMRNRTDMTRHVIGCAWEFFLPSAEIEACARSPGGSRSRRARRCARACCPRMLVPAERPYPPLALLRARGVRRMGASCCTRSSTRRFPHDERRPASEEERSQLVRVHLSPNPPRREPPVRADARAGRGSGGKPSSATISAASAPRGGHGTSWASCPGCSRGGGCLPPESTRPGSTNVRGPRSARWPDHVSVPLSCALSAIPSVDAGSTSPVAVTDGFPWTPPAWELEGEAKIVRVTQGRQVHPPRTEGAATSGRTFRDARDGR
jgi:hypothetical protein